MGYTGTSIWIDPVEGMYVILLTNRVHPTRENTKIQNIFDKLVLYPVKMCEAASL